MYTGTDTRFLTTSSDRAPAQARLPQASLHDGLSRAKPPGDPTFINALVNGEVAPIPAVRGVASNRPGSTQWGHQIATRHDHCPE
jgi:hypothetical protein